MLIFWNLLDDGITSASVCPGDGAISVHVLCSFRGTPILSDEQNNDDSVTVNSTRCTDVMWCVWPLTPQVQLHGPNSPHKINFHSLNHKTLYKWGIMKLNFQVVNAPPSPHLIAYVCVSSCRTVCIERGSINSLALNENPHYNHQKMLAAGTVSVNSTGAWYLI